MRHGMRMVAGALVLAGLLGVGCSSTPKGPVTVPMTFRPTDPISVTGEGLMTKSAQIIVEDRRDRKDQIGENTEKDVPVPVFAGTGQPADFVREALTRALSASGVAVSQPGGTAAERTIMVGLTRFWVDEGNTYKGNVAGTVRVLPAGGGQALWEGQAAGTNTRFGRSLKAENYQESLSDATVQMCNRLLADPGFRAALK